MNLVVKWRFGGGACGKRWGGTKKKYRPKRSGSMGDIRMFLEEEILRVLFLCQDSF